MAKKNTASAQRSAPPAASISDLPTGTGSARTNTKLICIYGPPKSRKTTSVARLPFGRTKWLVSDSNCVSTLDALDRLPDASDIYDAKELGLAAGISPLQAASDFLKKIVEIGAAKGKKGLGIDFLVVDSITQFFEWHQADVAQQTGQEYLGQEKGWDNNGYQKFNATFLLFLDLLTAASQYVTVIVLAHSQALHEKQKKGAFGGINLSERMSTAFGRKCNWILLKTHQRLPDDPSVQESELLKRVTLEDGTIELDEDLLYSSSTIDGYHASASIRPPHDTRTRWPGDLRVMLRAAGLMEEDEA